MEFSKLLESACFGSFVSLKYDFATSSSSKLDILIEFAGTFCTIIESTRHPSVMWVLASNAEAFIGFACVSEVLLDVCSFLFIRTASILNGADGFILFVSFSVSLL